MTYLPYLSEKEKQFIKFLGRNEHADVYTIQKAIGLSDDDRVIIPEKLVHIIRPALIKKITILGHIEPKNAASPYTLTSEGRQIAGALLKPWYKKPEIWGVIGALLTAIFTGILASESIFKSFY